MNHRGSPSAGPVDRTPQGPFCPAHSLTGRKLRHGVRGRQTGGSPGRTPGVVAGHRGGRKRTPGYRHPLTERYRRSPICVTPTTVSSRWVVHVVFSVVGPPSVQVSNRPVTCAVRVRSGCAVGWPSGTAMVRFRPSAGTPSRTTARSPGAGAPLPAHRRIRPVLRRREAGRPQRSAGDGLGDRRDGPLAGDHGAASAPPIPGRVGLGRVAPAPHRPGWRGLRPAVPAPGAPPRTAGVPPDQRSTGRTTHRFLVTGT